MIQATIFMRVYKKRKEKNTHFITEHRYTIISVRLFVQHNTKKNILHYHGMQVIEDWPDYFLRRYKEKNRLEEDLSWSGQMCDQPRASHTTVRVTFNTQFIT